MGEGRDRRWCKHGQHAAVSASTGEGISSGRRRKHRRGQHAAAETRAQTRASGVGHSRTHVQCVCVCVSDRGRSHSTRQGSGYESLDGTQRYGCADVVFCSTFLQRLGTYTTIAKRISRILGPFRSAPFSAPLRRHYMAFRLHRSLYRSHEHRRLHLRNLLHRRNKHRRVHLGSYTAAPTTLTLGLATVADLASLICGAEQLNTQSQRSC